MTSREDGKNEVGDSPDLKVTLSCGSIYLFKEKKANNSYRSYAQLILKGFTGLIISRRPPDQVRAKHNIAGGSFLWLTSNKGAELEVLAPNEISRLASLLVKFISGEGSEGGTPGKERVVLLENFEYLVMQNNFATILRVIHMVRDKIMLHPALLILPLDPMTMDFKDLRLIERECEVIDMKDY